MNSKKILEELKALSSSDRAKTNAWFFKTGPGQYGEGDLFWGIRVPQIREVVRRFRDISMDEITMLIQHKVHEVRLAGVLLLVEKSKKEPEAAYEIYLKNTKFINNWDLVDLSAGYVVGKYLYEREKKPIYDLAKSDNIWERRIAMISTFYFIRQGEERDALRIAEMLINDKHDLIQKAVGWMLREVGKNCSKEIEERFLDKHAATMPRTALRYAIEHFTDEKRKYYMGLKLK